MRRRLLLSAVILFSACESNADRNRDGVVEVDEYCETHAQLICDADQQCPQPDYVSHEQCMEAKMGACGYSVDRCEFDEDAARSCVSFASAAEPNCIDEPGADFDDCNNVFFDCEY